jgi:hypothetical protein
LCVDETLPDLQIKLVLAQTAPEARGNYEIFLRRDTATVDSRRGGASLAFCIDERRAYGRCDHRIILPLSAESSFDASGSAILAGALRLQKATQCPSPPLVFEEE